MSSVGWQNERRVPHAESQSSVEESGVYEMHVTEGSAVAIAFFARGVGFGHASRHGIGD